MVISILLILPILNNNDTFKFTVIRMVTIEKNIKSLERKGKQFYILK